MKMPPPEKMPPNGNSRSPHNGRADEPSFAERLARVEAMVQSAATKKEFAEIRGEIETLSERTESIRRELRADIGLVNERIEGVKRELNQKIESVRTELKAEMVTLNQKIDNTKNELNEKIESLRSDLKRQIESSANSNLKWMLGILLPFFTLLMTVFKFL